MSTFKSQEHVIAAERSLVYSCLRNPESFRSMADNMPESLKQKVSDIRIEGDTITMKANPVGDVSFRIGNSVENEAVTLETTSSPIPLTLNVVLHDGGQPATTIEMVEVKIDLNPILKSMLSKPLQEVANKFAELLANIPYNMLATN